MKKIFYLVNNEVMRNYQWVPLVNPPYSTYKFHLCDEQYFWFDVRHVKKLYQDLNDMSLWSIDENNKELFEKSCSELDIEIKEINLNNLYEEFCKTQIIYKPSPQHEIPPEKRVEICEESFNHIICGPGTSQVLLEHQIDEKDGIKLYINSNETAGHNIPHCHVSYNSESNYCVLSLVNFEKIAPDSNERNAVICKAQSILKNKIQKAREIWNKTSSPFKFVVVNGIYTEDFH